MTVNLFFQISRNGGGRSGLFCAVASLLEKVKVERNVSVVNAVRRVKARRSSAIHCQVPILCSPKGEHIVAALSVRPSVCKSVNMCLYMTSRWNYKCFQQEDLYVDRHYWEKVHCTWIVTMPSRILKLLPFMVSLNFVRDITLKLQEEEEKTCVGRYIVVSRIAMHKNRHYAMLFLWSYRHLFIVTLWKLSRT